MIKAAEVSGGKPSHPVTSGSPRRINVSRMPLSLSKYIKPAPSRNKGTTSLMYHSRRAIVFISTFENWGKRRGGSSTSSCVRSPGTRRAASQPTTSMTRKTTPPHTSTALKETPASIPITTPSCAEQGTASASSKVTSRRSRLDSRVRVVRVAMVTHPNPSTIGRTALPFNPSALNKRLERAARRGK